MSTSIATEQTSTPSDQQSLIFDLENNLLAAMSGYFDAIEKRFVDIETSLQHISGHYDSLVEDMVALNTLSADYEKDLEDAQQQNGERDIIINQLAARINQLEQEALSNTIEIIGIPPPPISDMKEDIRNILQVLATQIGAPPVADSVEDCYRVPAFDFGESGRRRRGGFIVVRLKNPLAKVAWLAARKNLRGGAQLSDATLAGSSGEQQFNSGTLGTIGLSLRKIKIHEQLTPNNKRLLFLTRVAAEGMNYKHVWVRHGTIFVKYDSERFTPVIRINGEDDLLQKMGFDVATLQAAGTETLI
jgi:hypothetical protein